MCWYVGHCQNTLGHITTEKGFIVQAPEVNGKSLKFILLIKTITSWFIDVRAPNTIVR
jgi:hypothetical protein